MFRGGGRRDRKVCEAQIRDLLQEERRLQDKARTRCARAATLQPGARTCQQIQARLYALRVQIQGERAKCVEATRLERKSALYEARAARAGQKTEIAAQREQRRQAALETKMARLEYRRARAEARGGGGENGQGGGSGKKLVAGGAIAAAAAAFLLL